MGILVPKPIEIFAPGTHTSSNGTVVTVSPEVLTQMVENFNRSQEPLPLVAGHPKEDAPSYGYATKLAVQEGAVVVVEAMGIDPTFQSIVNSGELNRVSVKLRLPAHPDNQFDVPEFRHIGFLGRSEPAIALREAAFTAASESHDEVFQMTISTETPIKLPAKEQERQAADPEFARQGEIQAQQAELDRQRQDFAIEMAEFKRARAIEPELENWIREGKILPGEKAGFTALFSRMPASLEIEFQAGDESQKIEAAAFLKGFLGRLPSRVDYTEKASPSDLPERNVAEFSAPPGYVVAPEMARLHTKALAYCKQQGWNPGNPGEFTKAVQAVTKES